MINKNILAILILVTMQITWIEIDYAAKQSASNPKPQNRQHASGLNRENPTPPTCHFDIRARVSGKGNQDGGSRFPRDRA